MNQDLIIVLGRLCSGKGTYSQPFIEQGYHHITTSDVVKEISGEATRSGLSKTADLDQAIADELVSRINEHEKVIIDGIRQDIIVRALLNVFPHAKMVWLEVDEELRKQRFEAREDRKDDLSFEDAEHADNKLGLRRLEKKFKDKCEIVET